MNTRFHVCIYQRHTHSDIAYPIHAHTHTQKSITYIHIHNLVTYIHYIKPAHTQCFVATDSSPSTTSFESLESTPSCVYIRSVLEFGQTQAWGVPRGPLEGIASLQSVRPEAVIAASRGEPVELVMFRQPSHSVAEEAMIVQPQVWPCFALYAYLYCTRGHITYTQTSFFAYMYTA